MSFNEYAATGFMILPWWTWPCIAVTVVCSILAVMKYDAWKDERAHAKTGPYPCLAHLGTDEFGYELWCHRREGHTEPHGYPEMFGDDDPVEGPEPVAGSLCTWGEDGAGNEHACLKPAGHLGAHMVQDLSDPSQH